MKPVMPPLRDKPYGGAWSIHDPESMEFLSGITTGIGNKDAFVNDYKEWICEGKNFKGMDIFSHLDFSAGTTETFHMFYFRHLRKRLRLFAGEFFYHHMMARNYFHEFALLEDDDIQSGDCVIMSCPFANTGNIPKNFYDILKRCDEMAVPVLLDLAYINISNIKELDLDYKCIETITTSLSKVFPVECHRIGLRLERTCYDDNLFAYNSHNYVNTFSVHIGHQFIKKFDNNWLYDKYKDKQEKMCEQMKLEKSNCVIFGLDLSQRYSEYNRGTDINRLCFSRVWDKRIAIV